MSRDTRYSITNPNVVHETIEGETIVLKLDTGVYYSLNEFGGEVWSLLGRGFSLDEIVATCVRGFDGPEEQIAVTARRLVSELAREDLIVVEKDPDDCASETGADTIAIDEKALRPPLRVPVMRKYEDMQDLLLIDPFHDVPAEGWPEKHDLHVPSTIAPSPIAAS